MRNYSGGGGSGATTTPDVHGFHQQDAARGGQRYYPCGVIFDENMGAIFGFGADLMYAMPLLSTRGMTVAGLHLRITVAAAAGKMMRMGIYDSIDDASNLYPNSLIVDGGAVLVDSTGVKSWVVNTALTEGKLYWVTILMDGAAQVRGGSQWMFWNLLGKASPNTVNSGSCLWRSAQAYGALPATFATVGAVALEGTSPCFFYSL